jgi:hypothetical protein
MLVVELEPGALGAAPALRVYEAAAPAVSLVHCAAHSSRDVARGRGRIRCRGHLARRRSLSEAAGLEPFQLLGDGLVDDLGEIAVRDLRAQERREPLELVAQLGAGGELDLETGGGQRLDDGAR